MAPKAFAALLLKNEQCEKILLGHGLGPGLGNITLPSVTFFCPSVAVALLLGARAWPSPPPSLPSPLSLPAPSPEVTG